MSAAADGDDGPLRHHKLCGFLRTILIPADPNHPPRSPIPGFLCTLVSTPSNIGFLTDDGVLLLPIQSPEPPAQPEPVADALSFSKRKKKKQQPRREIVPVNRSASVSGSVVHQLYTLVSAKCLKVIARVLRVASCADRVRAVVLVDIYLPISVWSGWQFPRFHALAASLFTHLSCNWEVRRSLLEFDWSAVGVTHIDDNDIWSRPDCGVLGCDKHLAKSRTKGAFELHAIFKSLPSAGRAERVITTRMHQEYPTTDAGIWDIADDVLSKVLAALDPTDLVRIGATCHHLRSLAVPIMPCTKLKLFPHQEAAVEWMLKRERHVDVLPHPLYVRFDTEDGFSFYVNVVSSEILTGVTPSVNDFRGGMFCDEPGLGKTVTALSLILKTYGTLADPPPDADVVWCTHDPDKRCGYYELTADNFAPGSFVSTWKRYISHSDQKGKASCSGSPVVISPASAENSRSSRKRGKSVCSEAFADPSTSLQGKAEISSCTGSRSMPAPRVIRSTRSLSRAKRNFSSLSNSSRVIIPPDISSRDILTV